MREALKGTFLDGAPIVPFSAVTGFGKERVCWRPWGPWRAMPVPPKRSPGYPPTHRPGLYHQGFWHRGDRHRLSSRVKGAGSGGHLPRATRPRCAPSRSTGKRWRGVGREAHRVNLQGLEKEELERGMVVAPPGALIKSRRLDAYLEILPSAPRPLKHRQAVRLHTGTSERVAMPLILYADEMPAGGSGYVQFFLREPLALKPGDRIVIRSFSPAFTWGGGLFLHVNPPRHKRRQPRGAGPPEDFAAGQPRRHPPSLSAEAGAGPLPGGTDGPLALGPGGTGQPFERHDAPGPGALLRPGKSALTSSPPPPRNWNSRVCGCWPITTANSRSSPACPRKNCGGSCPRPWRCACLIIFWGAWPRRSRSSRRRTWCA